MNTMSTKHQGYAAFLLYALGDAAFIATNVEDGVCFTFADDGTLQGLHDEFFSSSGAATSNALALLECSRRIRESIYQAKRSREK